MNLHEYQAKELFEEYGLPVSKRGVITNKNQIDDALSHINFLDGCVAKVQAHTGGRGKVGGVKLCKTIQDVELFVEEWLGNKIHTIQTDENGLPVNVISVEELTDINKELYLSLIVDRGAKSISMIVSEAGGMNIEEVAETTPEKILKVELNGDFLITKKDTTQLAKTLRFNKNQSEQFHDIVINCCKIFKDKDLSLLEINPLVITSKGDLHCLDAKINIDENALFRQEALSKKRDPSQEDPREFEAKQSDLSYVALEGNIGCMVNGAGLAMGTMDTIKLYNGEPANFLDVGGTATKERVSKAFKLILSDKNVRGILVNIFGGIVRCDLIAQGIVEAITEISVEIPIVVRLQGNQSLSGKQLLNKSGLNVIGEDSLELAAKKIVELVK
ncbi:MAG: ADP-forming succinate--CoA ligase subunit beta [Gammaproteobacteria bacterium]|uniref:Succinate--CoA ligase [ADP-forming] subunit beta n=1 Tax=SAR86 cluster bacterium TaxID=2030880 RepID=A0A520N1F3_9GAMM|nr:ADP-forming succinate--CoA ligase subunit beta [Gammaproteobacteria bacterium]MBA4729514.1 ADP-forming succinate--CoA ligase subunit beta [SAR86 cluster bacterium]RPG34846.1 MAG: ADP-forming succinate--CoA ligase subunit beta [Gammaproteobacteria bacterium TMED193]RZO27273.1 MAG: ADP-forming succinate--CoA ligase subunit beta [SAR86 cluster bacterium]|tara:strand:+ start:359 stop:1522 length:1164 start_codon:yes stop_codon:yes gene_type:complete